MSASAESLVARFVTSPAGQRLQEEARAELCARRQVLVQEIAAERKRIAPLVVRMNSDAEAAADAVNGAQKALDAAAAVLQSVLQKKLSAVLSSDHTIALREHELRSTADPIIGEFIRELNQLDEETRAQLVVREYKDKNWLVPRPAIDSNAAVINSRLTAIRTTREKAERLKLESSDAVTAVAELRRALKAGA